MTLMTVTLMTGNKINRPTYIYIIRWSGSSLHAARYAERGGDSRQDADGYLNHHFPSFFFHHLLLFNRFYDWGWMELMGESSSRVRAGTL